MTWDEMATTEKGQGPKVINDGLPEGLYLAICQRTYDPGESDYTPSSLNKPPLMARLEKDHANEIVEYASDLIWSFFGTMGHSVAEVAARLGGEHLISERRFYRTVTVDGKTFKIGAQVDLLDTKLGHLDDYKITSVWSVKLGIKAEWASQLNTGKWCIVGETGSDLAQELFITAILKDWKKRDAESDQAYPQKAAVRIEIPTWDLNETEQWIKWRVQLHEAAKRLPVEEIPECTPEERWERETTYAVKKGQNKAAVRGGVKTSLEEAQLMASQLGPGHWVEHRPGARTRCEDFCKASQWCPAFRRYKASQQTQRAAA